MTLAFFAEIVWKSLVISAAGLVLARLLGARSAADRASMLRLCVLLLLLLPLLAVGLPALLVHEPIAAPLIELYSPYTHLGTAYLAPTAAVEAMVAPMASRFPIEAIIFPAYVTGVLFMLVRLAAGVWTLDRWTREAAPVACPAWTRAFRRLLAATPGRVRLLVSSDAPSPMTWGVRRPVILIDRASHERPHDADAILAHEMAHVLRRDWPVLILSHVAVALFWFNPLVWWLEACLVHHTEEAADAQAVGRVEPVSYARTLLGCAGGGQALVAANGMAGSALARRLHAVLDPARRTARSGSPWTLGALAACIVLAGGLSALELVAPARAAPVAASHAAAVPKTTRAAEPAREALLRAGAATERALQEVGETAARALEQAERPFPVEEPSAQGPAGTDYADLTHALGVRSAQGLAGPGYRELTLDQLIQLQALGVTAADVEDYARAGYAHVSTDDLIAMTARGVTPEYIIGLADAGYAGLTPGALMGMHALGITPDFVRRLTADGHLNLSPGQLTDLKALGRSTDVVPPGRARAPEPAAPPRRSPD